MKERFIATCKIGLEALTASELRELSIEVEAVQDARVIFAGDFLDMARACLWLRTAERVLMIVDEFHAESFEALFTGVKRIHWKDYLLKNSFIHVNGKQVYREIIIGVVCADYFVDSAKGIDKTPIRWLKRYSVPSANFFCQQFAGAFLESSVFSVSRHGPTA